MKKNKEIIIWLVTDNKKGHEKQSESLAEEISRIIDAKIIKIEYQTVWSLITAYIRSSLGHKKDIKKPDITIGAGHSTHLRIMLTKIFFGGRTIVIMKPSLPISFFDLCIMPSYDLKGNIKKSNRILTSGPLTKSIKKGRTYKDRGLILIGGTSKHFKWESQLVLDEIIKIINYFPKIKFCLSISRRTPQEFIDLLSKFKHPNLVTIKDFSKVKSLEDKIAECQNIWVTCDSISMVYEALNSGGSVGLIMIKESSKNKVTKLMANLIQTSSVMTTDFITLRKSKHSAKNNEAVRCAKLITTNWFIK